MRDAARADKKRKKEKESRDVWYSIPLLPQPANKKLEREGKKKEIYRPSLQTFTSKRLANCNVYQTKKIIIVRYG